MIHIDIDRQASRLLGVFLALSAPPAFGHGAPVLAGQPERVLTTSITSVPDTSSITALILDAPRPGILLNYRGNSTITVLGRDNEAMLRFSREKVEANTTSPTWQSLPNTERPERGLTNASSVASDAQWVTVSDSSRFGWLDPRLTQGTQSHEFNSDFSWTIPIRTTDDKTTRIQGRGTFEALELTTNHP